MDIINELLNKDHVKAYHHLLQLELESTKSNALYTYFDDFLKLLENESSYVKMRGFRLICAQAQWDIEFKIEKNIDTLLHTLDDDKPALIRQCLAALHIVLLYKTGCNDKIANKVNTIDITTFKDSVRPLIKKDIEELRNAMI